MTSGYAAGLLGCRAHVSWVWHAVHAQALPRLPLALPRPPHALPVASLHPP